MGPGTLSQLEQSEAVAEAGLGQGQLVAALLPWTDAALLADLLRLRREADAALLAAGSGLGPRKRADYPLGACKPIRDFGLSRLLTCGGSDADRPALQAFSRFRQAGGVLKGIWGIQKGIYFQNAIQAGDLWVDLANDTVDLSRPPVEVCRLADARFEEVASFDRLAEVARLYWNAEAYPNHILPAVAAVLPLIFVWPDGAVRLAAPTTLLPRNIRLDYTLAEAFLIRGDRASRRLPEPVLRQLADLAATRSGWFATAGPWGIFEPAATTDQTAAALAAERDLQRHLDEAAATRRFVEIVRTSSRPLLAGGRPAPHETTAPTHGQR